MRKKNFLIVLLFIGLLLVSSCKSNSSISDKIPTTNSKVAQAQPYVILISLDGFRWDYVERFQPPFITNFIKNGVKAASLIPSFPSKTFPNHYTIATGMYPENHGIIGNSFYSYKKNKLYKLGNREAVEDGSFYNGTPIWVAAEKMGMVSASFFFVGSEADIQGIHPSYYYKFDNSIKNEVRIKQAIDWLALPPKSRPHLITMYFSDMDDIGHSHGPDSAEKLKETLLALDKHLGNLFNEVKKTGLPVNIILVSDHGMSNISVNNYIPIETIENTELYTTLNNGSIANIHPKDKSKTDSIYTFLKTKEHNFKVYKTAATPGFEYTPMNDDWGTIQVLPDFGYYFLSNAGIAARKKSNNTIFGVHGYDTKQKDMHGIFYANGPAFKKGLVIPAIKNIHIYPVLCKLLGLKIPDTIDGDINQLKSVLKEE